MTWWETLLWFWIGGLAVLGGQLIAHRIDERRAKREFAEYMQSRVKPRPPTR